MPSKIQSAPPKRPRPDSKCACRCLMRRRFPPLCPCTPSTQCCSTVPGCSLDGGVCVQLPSTFCSHEMSQATSGNTVVLSSCTSEKVIYAESCLWWCCCGVQVLAAITASRMMGAQVVPQLVFAMRSRCAWPTVVEHPVRHRSHKSCAKNRTSNPSTFVDTSQPATLSGVVGCALRPFDSTRIEQLRELAPGP